MMSKRKQTAEDKRRIVLLDTHAILHRAYHAIPDLTSPSGEPTGALYGLTSFLTKVINELDPDHIVAAFDLPQPTKRHEVYEGYKATREKADDALIAQLERARDLLSALSVPWLEVPGYEADDILGTLAGHYAKKGYEVIIASGDMDTLQLVQGDLVRVYTLKRGISDTVIYDEDGVRARYGFGPELLADYKGLRGDPSDNIIGIKGIGEKTATQLVVGFGDLETLFDIVKNHPERLAEAGIRPRIIDLLREGEDDALFSKELATIDRNAPIDPPNLSYTWKEGADREKVFSICSELGFRTLATRLRATLEPANNSGEGPETAPQPEDETLLKETALALWVLRSDVTNPSLADILEYTGASDLPTANAKILQELHDAGITKVFKEIELPLMPVVARMEERGILLDTTYLELLSKRYHKDLDTLAVRIFEAAGTEFNINSPRQLGEVLFETLKIGDGKGKKTATGQRSTREEELRKYADDEPIVADILEYRELQKLLSTYIDNLPGMCGPDGRLHAHFSQTGTTTGRMSSQSPNMQNIPIKTTRGAAIRKAIVAPEGFTLLAADYSQIELRVAAFLSGDEKLIDVFKQGQDIHTAVAAQVFDVPPELVDKDMRRKAKAINFGILYGMGANALAVATGTSKSEAQTYLKEYFKRFAGIARYMETVKADVHVRGYTETWFGRRRHFEGIRSPVPYIVAQAERMALNAPIQGTQADIIKIAMVRIDERLKEADLMDDAFLISQVHDELMFEVRDGALGRVVEVVRDAMQGVLSLEETKGVPLQVDIETGKNWGEMNAV